MADFDIIETFNPADETINFGTRCIGDGNNLYEVVTLSSFGRLEKDNEENTPELRSCFKNEHLYLSLGNVLHVFGNPSNFAVLYRVNFDATVDTISVTEKYFLVGLRNGSILLIDVKSYEIVLTRVVSETVWNDDPYFIETFIEVEDNESGMLQFILVNKLAHVYRVSVMLTNEEEPNYTLETIVDLKKDVTFAVMTNNVILLNGVHLLLCDLNEPDNKKSLKLSLEKAYADGLNQFIGLLDDGSLVTICARTYQVTYVNCEIKFEDFVFYGGKEDVCFGSVLDVDERYLRLLSFPSFTETFSLKTQYNAHLVYSHNNDEQIFVSRVKNNEFRLQMITEAVPEKRLERLLKKQKFDEAEQFARMYNLDIEMIHKAKALMLTEQATCDADEIDELIGLLKNIKDLVFNFKCCLEVTSDFAEGIYRVLSYGCSLCPSSVDIDESTGYDYINLINETMFKFETYKIILKYKNITFDYSSWNDFCNCHPFDYLYANLRPNNIEASIVLYARLDSTTMYRLSEDNIKSILNILMKMQTEVYTPFLSIFISKTLLYQPTSLPIFVQWISSCVHSIETYYYANFPENAIEFLQKILHLLDLNSASIQYERYGIESEILLAKLYTLAKALDTIHTFQNRFMVFVPLKDCLKGPVSLVNALLFMESIEVDESLMAFLSNYLIENRFHPDEIYFNVIMELMSYEDKYWLNSITSIWKSIQAAETKLKALMEVLCAASVPWSNILKDICKEALELKHPLVKLVELETKREPIYIVLRRKVYNLMNEKMDSVINDSDIFTIKRIIACNQPTMQEDVYALCLTPKKKKVATDLLLDNYIMKGDLSKASLLINEQSPDDLENIYDLFIKMYSNYCQNKFSDDICKESYIKFASYLLLKEDTNNSTVYYKNIMNAIRTCDIINKQYETDFTYTDITTDAQKETVLDIVLNLAVQKYKSSKKPNMDIIKDVLKLSSILAVDEYKVLLKLCEMYKDVSIYYHAIEYAYSYSTEVETLCVVAAFMLKTLGSTQIQLNGHGGGGDSSFGECSEDVVVNTDLIKTCLVYARKAVVKALTISDSSEYFDVYNWISCSFISDEVTADKCGLFQNTYPIKASIFSTISVDAVRGIFRIYLGYVAKHDVHSKPMSYFLRNCEYLKENDLLHQVNTMVPVLLQNLCADDNHFAACNLIICLKNSLVFYGETNEQVHNTLLSLLMDCNSKLLKKAFAHKYLDETLLMNLLLFYSYEKAVSIIKQGISLYQRDFVKFESISRLGMRYASLHNNANDSRMFEKSLFLTKWWRNFDNCVVPFKEFYSLSRDQILFKLIEHNSMSMVQIQKYCSDFKMDVKDYYSTYLETQLMNWRLVYTVGVDGVGKRSLNIENDGQQLYEECIRTVDNISDKDGVYTMLSDISTKINLYQYEVFNCIISIMALLKPEKNEIIDVQLQLLKFLKGYTRYSKPSDTEMDEWYKMFPDSQNIDALSEWRIPFTPTLFNDHIGDILKAEMNLNSYSRWLETMPILSKYLTKTDICCYAIKSVVTSGVWKQKQDSEWILHSKHNDLIGEIDACLQHIPDIDKAASVAYYILKYVPPGADLVTTAKLCLRYALQYKNAQLPGKHEQLSITAHKNVYNKYHSYATKHILHVNFLADQKYLDAVTQPLELIQLLYADDRITKHNVLNCPDINKAADEIGELYNLNMMDIRLSIVENLLANDLSTNINLEESICINPIGNNYNYSENKYEKRISYICMSGDIKVWQNYLMTIGLEQVNTKYSYQAKALKCLFAISTPEEIIKFTQFSYKEFLFIVDELFLIHDMQSLGIQMDQETLSSYNKDDLLKQLSRNIGNTLSIKVMSSICVIYKIYNLKYWDVIITNMIKFNMFSDLKTCVDFLRSENVLYKPFFIQAWQTLVDNSFIALLDYSGDDLGVLCIDNMHAIQSCPVLYRLDLKTVFKICLRLKRVGMAALLIQYLAENEQTYFIKELLQCADKKQIIEDVEKLFESGFVGTQFVSSIIQKI